MILRKGDVKMEIVFIRHGQTDVNKDNRIQGAQVDADLNEFGREYAKNPPLSLMKINLMLFIPVQ